MTTTPIPIDTERSPTVILELIQSLKVRDVMNRSPITAERRRSLRSVQKLMKANGISGVPIVEEGRIFGIVSMGDIISALDNGVIEHQADEYMTKKVIVLEDEMPLSFAISYFNKYNFGRFPVLNKDKKLVGVLTSRDILNKLVLELNQQVTALESQIPVAAPANTNQIYKEFRIQKYDMENAGKASNEIKKILQSKGLSPKDIRRVAVAVYELEINLVIHSDGGKVAVTIDTDSAEIVASDTGPGIKDIALAMKEGYSTAVDWIRSHGFGAGMGLANVKRVSSEFAIDSQWGVGTTVRALLKFNEVPKEASL